MKCMHFEVGTYITHRYVKGLILDNSGPYLSVLWETGELNQVRNPNYQWRSK